MPPGSIGGEQFPHYNTCSVLFGRREKWHISCGGKFVDQGHRRSLKCDGCDLVIAKTSDTVTAEQDRESVYHADFKDFVGNMLDTMIIEKLHTSRKGDTTYEDSYPFMAPFTNSRSFWNVSWGWHPLMDQLEKTNWKRTYNDMLQNTDQYGNSVAEFKWSVYSQYCHDLGPALVLYQNGGDRLPPRVIDVAGVEETPCASKLELDSIVTKLTTCRALYVQQISESYEKRLEERRQIVYKIKEYIDRREKLTSLEEMDGFCYLKMIPQPFKEEASIVLGERPTVKQICEYKFGKFEFVHGYDLVIVSSNNCHVVRKPGNCTSIKVCSFYKRKPNYLVGSIVEEEAMEIRRIVDEFLAVPCHMEDDEEEDPFEKAAEEIFGEPIYGPAPTKLLVKGEGNCWKNLPIDKTKVLIGGEKDFSVSAQEILLACKAINKSVRKAWFVEWYDDDDGSVHVESCSKQYGRNPPEDMDPLDEFMEQLQVRIDEMDDGEQIIVGYSSKAPLDVAVAQFTSPEHRRNNEAFRQPQIAQYSAQVDNDCPYYIPPAVQHHMEKLSIPWSTTCANVVPHPIHAAIRRWELKHVIPKEINTDVTVVSMGATNVEWLRDAMTDLGKDYKIEIKNSITDMKDMGRYLQETGNIPEDVFTLDEVTTPTVVFHNSGQFMNESFPVHFFKNNPDVRVMIVSHVYPLERLIVNHSTIPALYTWVDNENGTFTYTPEGDVGGSYEQPSSPGMLLCNKWIDEDGEIMLVGGIVASKLNTHIQVITSYNLVAPQYVPISMEGFMPFPRLFRAMPKDLEPIRTDMYRKLFEYGKALQKMKEQDLWGKIRQMADEEAPYLPVGDKSWLVQTIIEAIDIRVSAKLQSKAINGPLDSLKYKTLGAVSRIVDEMFVVPYLQRNRKLVNEPYPIQTLETHIVRVKYVPSKGVYGVRWQIPAENRGRWWKQFILMFKKFVGLKSADPKSWYLDDNGCLQNLQVPGWTKENRIRYGKRELKEKIIKDFKQVMMHKPDLIVLSQNVVDDTTETRSLKPGDEITFEGSPMSIVHGQLGPTEIADVEMVTAVYSEEPLKTVTMVTASDTEDEEPVQSTSKGKMKAISLSEHNSALDIDMEKAVEEELLRHCDFCVTFGQWRGETHAQYHHYIAAMEKMHQFVNNGDIEMASVTQAPPSWMAVRQATEPIKVEPIVKSTFGVTGSLYEKLEPGVPSKQVAPNAGDMPAKITRNRKKHEACVKQWLKIVKNQPRNVQYNQGAAGVVLWDQIFPLSVDKRYVSVPYKDVRCYPIIDYPDQDCMLVAVSQVVARDPAEILLMGSRAFPGGSYDGKDLPLKFLHAIGCALCVGFEVQYDDDRKNEYYGVKCKFPRVLVVENNNHIYAAAKQRGLVVMKPIKPLFVKPHNKAIKLMAEIVSLPAATEFEWIPSKTRACGYIRAMMQGEVGLLHQMEINIETLKSWDSSFEKMSPKVRRFVIIEGEAGCRKSSGLQKILRNKFYHTDNCFNITLPVNDLAHDWRDKIAVRDPLPGKKSGTPSTYVTTFEVTIARGTWGWVMVFDEDKYPKGYFDVVALLFPWVSMFVFCCDRYQSRWHNPTKTLLNDDNIMGNAQLLAKYANRYLRGTWRFGPNIANFCRYITYNNHGGSFHFGETVPKNWTDLIVYFPKAKHGDLEERWKKTETFYASHVGAGWGEQLLARETGTYASSQGISCEITIVQLDQAVLSGLDYRLLHTVLTRGKDVIIISAFAQNAHTDRLINENKILRLLYRYRETYRKGDVVRIKPEWSYSIEEVLGEPLGDVEQIAAGPPDKIKNEAFISQFMNFDYKKHYIDPDETRVGARQLYFDEPAYKEAYTFKPFILGYERVNVREEGVLDTLPQEAKIPTHLPVAKETHLFEKHYSEVIERYDAELSFKSLYSEQKPDTYMFKANRFDIIKNMAKKEKLKPHHVMKMLEATPYDERQDLYMPKALNFGQDQKAKDEASFKAGVQQRIRRGNFHENMQEIMDETPYGNALWEALCKSWGWNPDDIKPLEPMEKERAQEEFEGRRADRSENLKKMSLNRSEPEYADFLTAKTQWKMKDLGATVAKPLQTILVRSDAYLMKFGWVGVTLLDRILADLPDHVYLHAKKSINQMREYFGRMMRGDSFEILDISGLDGSVRGGAVVLMTRLMRRYGIPEDLIEDYTKDKADFKTRSMHFAIMTFSGELFTWLINTIFTMARECLKYDIKYGEPIAGSGDDILRLAGLFVSPQWAQWEPYDHCKEKRSQSNIGEFCSFLISKGVLLKDPIILYKRLVGQLERGKKDEIAYGYFELFAHNYMLGDNLYDLLNEEQMEAVVCVNRIMFNLSKHGIYKKLPWHILHEADLALDPGERPDKNFVLRFIDVVQNITGEITDNDILSTYTMRESNVISQTNYQSIDYAYQFS